MSSNAKGDKTEPEGSTSSFLIRITVADTKSCDG